jgi:hypothetical protein
VLIALGVIVNHDVYLPARQKMHYYMPDTTSWLCFTGLSAVQFLVLNILDVLVSLLY